MSIIKDGKNSIKRANEGYKFARAERDAAEQRRKDAMRNAEDIREQANLAAEEIIWQMLAINTKTGMTAAEISKAMGESISTAEVAGNLNAIINSGTTFVTKRFDRESYTREPREVNHKNRFNIPYTMVTKKIDEKVSFYLPCDENGNIEENAEPIRMVTKKTLYFLHFSNN